MFEFYYLLVCCLTIHCCIFLTIMGQICVEDFCNKKHKLNSIRPPRSLPGGQWAGPKSNEYFVPNLDLDPKLAAAYPHPHCRHRLPPFSLPPPTTVVATSGTPTNPPLRPRRHPNWISVNGGTASHATPPSSTQPISAASAAC